jgi:hypothetical protein
MIGHDGFDHFGEDDFNYDDDMPFDLRIAPEAGHVGIVGQAAILEGPDGASASGTSWAVPKIAEEIAKEFAAPPLEDPADLWWTPIARLIMSPSRYRGEWLPHISDMNSERHECLKRGDVAGATWAVIRAHFYSLPRWLLVIPGGFVLNFVRHWFGF